MQLKLTDFGLKLDPNQKKLTDFFSHATIPKGQSTLFAKVNE